MLIISSLRHIERLVMAPAQTAAAVWNDCKATCSAPVWYHIVSGTGRFWRSLQNEKD